MFGVDYVYDLVVQEDGKYACPCGETRFSMITISTGWEANEVHALYLTTKPPDNDEFFIDVGEPALEVDGARVVVESGYSDSGVDRVHEQYIECFQGHRINMGAFEIDWS